jgi:transcriptional regulator with XRE-family HTH domain
VPVGPADIQKGNTMTLLREAIGERLRRTRTSQRRTLREVSRVARVSLGYLSEVERGRKEASSELLGSICDALDLPLDELLRRVADDLGPVYLPEVPDTVPAELVAA